MGRLPSRKEPQQPLQHLMPRHRAMARYFAIGAKNTEICRLFGMSSSRVSIIANSPLMKAEIRRLQGDFETGTRDIHKEMIELSHEAFDIVAEDLITQEKSPSKTKLALEVLDRAGVSRGSKPADSDARIPIQIVINTPGPEDRPERTPGSETTITLKE